MPDPHRRLPAPASARTSARLPVRLSRRHLLLGGVGLVGVAALGACASSQSVGASAGATAAAANASLGPTDTFPITIEHAFGRTTVSAEPRTVVAVGPVSADVSIALGVVPAALPQSGTGADEHGLYPWTERALEALGVDWESASAPTIVGDLGEGLDQATVAILASLEPDLILGVAAGLTRSQYESLSRIAPTIAPPAGLPDGGVPWDQATTVIGQALGRSAAAEALIRTTQTEASTAAASYPVLSESTYLALHLTLPSLLPADGAASPSPSPSAAPSSDAGTTPQLTPATAVTLYTQADARSRFLELVGLKPAPALQSAGKKGGSGEASQVAVAVPDSALGSLTADLVWADLSPATAAELGAQPAGGGGEAESDTSQGEADDADQAAASDTASASQAPALAPAGASPEVLDELAADATLAAVPAVGEGKAYVVTGAQVLAAITQSSPLSLPWLCEHHLPELAGVVERARGRDAASAAPTR